MSKQEIGSRKHFDSFPPFDDFSVGTSVTTYIHVVILSRIYPYRSRCGIKTTRLVLWDSFVLCSSISSCFRFQEFQQLSFFGSRLEDLWFLRLSLPLKWPLNSPRRYFHPWVSWRWKAPQSWRPAYLDLHFQPKLGKLNSHLLFQFPPGSCSFFSGFLLTSCWKSFQFVKFELKFSKFLFCRAKLKLDERPQIEWMF